MHYQSENNVQVCWISPHLVSYKWKKCKQKNCKCNETKYIHWWFQTRWEQNTCKYCCIQWNCSRSTAKLLTDSLPWLIISMEQTIGYEKQSRKCPYCVWACRLSQCLEDGGKTGKDERKNKDSRNVLVCSWLMNRKRDKQHKKNSREINKHFSTACFSIVNCIKHWAKHTKTGQVLSYQSCFENQIPIIISLYI